MSTAARTTRSSTRLCLGALFAGACLIAGPTLARPIVPQPTVSVSPAVLTLAPGASAVVTARPGGGEAIRFAIDWTVQEGAAGGTISAPTVAQDGSSSVTYTAPAGRGPFHLVAALHNQAAVRAVATVKQPD